MPGPAGQHTHILQQETGYEKGNERPDGAADDGVTHRALLARIPFPERGKPPLPKGSGGFRCSTCKQAAGVTLPFRGSRPGATA
jgi:hypothetical protein